MTSRSTPAADAADHAVDYAAAHADAGYAADDAEHLPIGPFSGALPPPRDPHPPAVDPEQAERITELLTWCELGAVHRLRAAAARVRTSEPEFLVLSELGLRPAGLTGAQLTGITGIGSGGISGILTRLEEQELVERGPDPWDGRGTVSVATDAGRELVRDDVSPGARHAVARILDGLPPERIELLAEFLGLVADRAYVRSRTLREQRPRR